MDDHATVALSEAEQIIDAELRRAEYDRMRDGVTPYRRSLIDMLEWAEDLHLELRALLDRNQKLSSRHARP
jgi:hypothetical protein